MKTEIKYGLIIGVLTASWFIGEFFLGLRGNTIISRLVLAIPVAGIFLGLREKKKKFDGFFNIWRGIRAGIIISAIAAAFMAIFMYIYLIGGLANQIGDDLTIEDPVAYIVQLFIRSIFMGMLISGLISFAVRDK